MCIEFDGKRQIKWQGLSCNRNGSGFVKFFGDQGAMEIEGSGAYTIFDLRGKGVKTQAAGARGDAEHLANFLNAIRNDDPLSCNAEIEEGYKSTLLCHLGNIAHRTGRTLNCESQHGHIVNDPAAMELWGREYEPGWEPKV